MPPSGWATPFSPSPGTLIPHLRRTPLNGSFQSWPLLPRGRPGNPLYSPPQAHPFCLLCQPLHAGATRRPLGDGPGRLAGCLLPPAQRHPLRLDAQGPEMVSAGTIGA